MKIAVACAVAALLGFGVPLLDGCYGADAPGPGAVAPLRAESPQVPYKQESDTRFGVLILRTAAGLGVQGFSKDGKTRIQLVESRRITPKLTLLLIDFEGERLLLAHSGDRVVHLGAHGSMDAFTQEARRRE